MAHILAIQIQDQATPLVLYLLRIAGIHVSPSHIMIQEESQVGQSLQPFKGILTMAYILPIRSHVLKVHSTSQCTILGTQSLHVDSCRVGGPQITPSVQQSATMLRILYTFYSLYH